jgi:hypothetical protein
VIGILPERLDGFLGRKKGLRRRIWSFFLGWEKKKTHWANESLVVEIQRKSITAEGEKSQ